MLILLTLNIPLTIYFLIKYDYSNIYSFNEGVFILFRHTYWKRNIIKSIHLPKSVFNDLVYFLLVNIL